MLDKIGAAFKNAFEKIHSAVFLDKELQAIISDLRRSLLLADVSPSLANEICDSVKRAAREGKGSLEKRERVTKALYDKLVSLLGEKSYELDVKRGDVIFLVGLFGSGKTTTAAKLAALYKRKGYKVALLGLDTHRPAAPEQLEQLAAKAGVAVFVDKSEKDPLKIWKRFAPKINGYDITFVDTAGRDAFDDSLLSEIKTLYREIRPDKVLLVVPAEIGRVVEGQAAKLATVCDFDGVFVSRLDGSAKGGGAIAACSQTKSKVLFVGTGEKLSDIEAYDPVRYVSKLLCKGDLRALLEKAKTALPKGKLEAVEKAREGRLTLSDLREQLTAMKRMGPLGQLVKMIPGLASLPNLPGLEVGEAKMKKWVSAIDSMTPAEREKPESLTASRIDRVARGAGIQPGEVKELLRQFKVMRNMLGGGTLSNRRLQALLKGFSGKLPF